MGKLSKSVAAKVAKLVLSDVVTIESRLAEFESPGGSKQLVGSYNPVTEKAGFTLFIWSRDATGAMQMPPVIRKFRSLKSAVSAYNKA